MPPADMPQPTLGEFDALIGWVETWTYWPRQCGRQGEWRIGTGADPAF